MRTTQVALQSAVVGAAFNRAIEKAIATETIAAVLAAGYEIEVNDGERAALPFSTDPAAILSALFATDEESLICDITHPDGKRHRSFVRFVWGNDGWDCIADHGISLEEVLKPVFDKCNRIESGEFTITF